MVDDIKLDINDFNSFWEEKGEIHGCVKAVTKDNFKDEIINPYKNYLLNAKAVLVEFNVNKIIPLFILDNYMSIIHDYVSNEASLIFGLNYNNNLNEDTVVCKILISGLDSK
jgi:cell division GTPase FtsZ